MWRILILSPNLKGRYLNYKLFNSEVCILASSYVYGSMHEARCTVRDSCVERVELLFLHSLFWG